MQRQRNKRKQTIEDKLKIKKAKELLYDYGYQTHILYHIDDVKTFGNVDDIKAYEILLDSAVKSYDTTIGIIYKKVKEIK